MMNLLSILGAHVLWLTAAAFFLRSPSGWPLALASLFFLGAQWIQRRSLSEWIHEGAHFNFLANPRWNDRVLNLLAAPFFLEEISLHRTRHFGHHRPEPYFRETDPDTALLAIRTRRDLRAGFLADLCGFTAWRAIRIPTKFKAPAGILRKDRWLRAMSLAGHTAALVTLVGIWQHRGLALFGLYTFSLISLYPVFNRIRVYTQHLELGAQGSLAEGSRASRTVWTRGVDRWFLHSSVMMYHWEHHHYPSLHYRQLAQICRHDHTDPNRYTVGRWSTLRRLYLGFPAV